jgi:hypothetical protein
MTDDLPDRLDQAAADHVKWPDSTPDDQTIDDLRAAAAELRRLRSWKASAMNVLREWDDVWEALDRPGPLAGSKATNSLRAVRHLSAVLDAIGDPDNLRTLAAAFDLPILDHIADAATRQDHP